MRKIAFILILLLWPGGAPPAIAADSAVKVGVYQNRPKVFMDDQGRAKGFFIDLVEYMAAKENWTIQYVPGSWTECLDKLEKGEIDLMVDMAYSEERAEKFDFNKVVTFMNWAVVYLPRESGVTSLIDLDGKKIAVMKGDISYQELKERTDEFHLACEYVEAESFKAVFELIETGQADAGLISRLFGLENEKNYTVTRSGIICCPKELFFAAPKNRNQQLLAAVDKHLAAMKSDKQSVYYHSLMKWIEGIPPREFPQWAIWFLVLTGGAASILLTGVVILRKQVAVRTSDLSEANLKLLGQITERKKIEEELIQSERKYREFLETLPDMVYRFRVFRPEAGEDERAVIESYLEELRGADENDLEELAAKAGRELFSFMDGTILEANQTASAMLGYPLDNLGHIRMAQLISRANLMEALKTTCKIFARGYQTGLELHLTAADGKNIPVNINANLADNVFPYVIQGVARDVTAQKQAEEELMHLVTAIRHAAESIVITDREANIQYINPAFEQITGYSRAEVIGRNPRILQSGRHNAGFYKEMWNTISGGQVWKGHFTNKKKDGSLFEEEASIAPIKDNNGKIISFVAVKRDVTQEMAMENRMRQAQKMEAMGTLAGGIAHDFNNILSAIIGFTQLSLDRVQNDPVLLANLQEVLTAGNRAKDLVRQILTFSRQTAQERQPMDPAPIVKEVLKLLRASLPSNLEIHQNISGDVSAIMADPTEVHQVMMNLCTNAGQATGERGGILEVNLSNTDLDEEYTAQYLDLLPGPYVKLVVSDTGMGMSPEIMAKIFDPFFTTKKPGEGTGLGLAVVHGIVQSYGGMIKVYSEPGNGTSFQLFFPAIKLQAGPRVEGAQILPTGSEKVLVVDDEPVLAEMNRQILERLGYQVTTRISSLEALELFKTRPDAFDLVVTDMTMPKMTGDALAAEISRIRPEIPIILCTGYSARITEEKITASGIRAIIMKPVTLTDMAVAVRKVLDDKGPTAGKV